MSRDASFAEWYTEGRLAPYLHELRVGAGGVQMLDVRQPAGDMSDPPTSDLVISRIVSPRVRHRSDLGAGPFDTTARAGMLFVAPPHTGTDIEVFEDHAVRSCSLPAERCRELLAEADCSDTLDFGPVHADVVESPMIMALLDVLWTRIDAEDDVSRLFIDGATLAILAELLNLAGAAPANQQCKPDWRLRRVIDYLEARLGEDIGMTEVADFVGLSPPHLSALFRGATGLPLHRWLVNRRVQRSCQLLCDPRLSVTDIACALGFSSSQHFATTFRKHLGTTPTRYRQQRLS